MASVSAEFSGLGNAASSFDLLHREHRCVYWWRVAGSSLEFYPLQKALGRPPNDQEGSYAGLRQQDRALPDLDVDRTKQTRFQTFALLSLELGA